MKIKRSRNGKKKVFKRRNNKNQLASYVKNDLTIKEQLFIKEYLIDFNATRAYTAAYNNPYARTAEVNGHNALRKTKIMTEVDKQIRERMERLDVKNDMIIAQLRDWVFMDIRQFYNADGSFKDIHDLNVFQQSAIEVEELSEDRERIGTMRKVKFVNRLEAKKTLMKYFDMIKDKSGDQYNQYNLNLRLEVDKLKGLSDNDLDDLERILAKGERKAIVGCSANSEGRKTPY